MTEAKAMTLVERLREFEELQREIARDWAGNKRDMHLANATIAQEAITALEAAEKALEPFAKHYFAPAYRDDETVAEFWRIGDLRLARSVYQKIKGDG